MGTLCSERCDGLPRMIEPAGARAMLDTRVVWWPAPWCAGWASPGSWSARRCACHGCVSVGRCTLELAQAPLESCTGMACCRGRLTLGGGGLVTRGGVEPSAWPPQAPSQSAAQHLSQCMLEPEPTPKPRPLLHMSGNCHGSRCEFLWWGMLCGAITGTGMHMQSRHSVCGASCGAFVGAADIVGGVGQLQRLMHRRC